MAVTKLQLVLQSWFFKKSYTVCIFSERVVQSVDITVDQAKGWYCRKLGRDWNCQILQQNFKRYLISKFSCDTHWKQLTEDENCTIIIKMHTEYNPQKGKKRRGGGLQNFLHNCWSCSKILRLHAFIININTVHLPKAESFFFFFFF